MTNRSKQPVKSAVLLVSVSLVYGGSETYYVKLAKILVRQHVVIAVVCNRRMEREFSSLGIHVAYVGDDLTGMKRYFRAVRACHAMAARFHPECAHLNGQPESYLAPFLRLLGLRVLTTRHTPFTDLFMMEGSRIPVKVKRWMVLLSLRCAARTICVSQLLYRQLSTYLPSNRIRYIPTWVEDTFLEHNERPFPEYPLRALFVGRIVANKGILDVIEAVRRCPNVQLTVVGEGDQMEAARHLAAGLPIVFTGFLSDCKLLYRSSDLLVFASREGFEGLPQVPMEAMAVGLPCLASDISSILELAEVDRPEFNSSSTQRHSAIALYRQGDIDDLVRRLAELAADRIELQRLSRAGRRQVETRFTASVVGDRYLREFASLKVSQLQ